EKPRPRPATPSAPLLTKSPLDLLAQLAPILAGLPLAFYVGGTLLSFGFFFSIGLTPLTAFSPTEVAMAGWLRIAGSTFLVAPVLVIASVVAWPVSSTVADKVLEKRPQLATAALSALVAVGCIMGAAWAQGVLQALLSAITATLFGVFAIAFAFKREEALRKRVRPLRWWLLTFFAALSFAALGEAAFVAAMRPGLGGAIRLTVPGGAACVRPLLLGADRLIYERDGAIILSDYEGKAVATIGRLQRRKGERAGAPLEC
ncbi:MAG: hypothetical protein ABW128_09320, partial [Rhizorhabdus sp.]